MTNLQLVKVKSTLQPKIDQNKCYVYVLKEQILNKYQFNIDQQTTIKEIINKSLDKCDKSGQNIEQMNIYELYASKRDGRIVNDLPSFDHNQSVLRTKQKYFFLKEKTSMGKDQMRRSTNITKSISSEMNLQKKYHQEILPKKIQSCFCL